MQTWGGGGGRRGSTLPVFNATAQQRKRFQSAAAPPPAAPLQSNNICKQALTFALCGWRKQTWTPLSSGSRRWIPPELA